MLLLPLGCLEPTAQTESTPVATTTANLPTLAQIRADVDMSDTQAEKLGTAVERWHSAERSGSAAETFVSPELEFVAESAAILDRQQLRQLVGVLARHRAANNGQQNGTQQRQHAGNCPGGPAGGMGPGAGAGMQGGPHRGGPGGGPGGRGDCVGQPDCGGAGPFASLGLSAEQLQAVHEAMQTMRTAMRAAHDQFESGALTEEAFRQAVDAARQAFDAALQGILTPEQYATLQQQHLDRFIEHLERRIEHMRAGAARHLELLTQILDLSPTQVQAIADIHAGIVPRLEAIVAGVKDGSLTLDAAQTALRTVHEETRTAIVAVLTPEQATLFEDLRPLGRRHCPGMPPG